MNCKPITTLVLFSLLFIANSFASDTTKTKRPLWLSISAGFTSNKVYGSMVDKNEQFDKSVQQENTTGYAINFQLIKPFANILYFKTGLNYINKRVDPQQHTGNVYKDRLNTHYLSLPVLFGIQLLPLEKKLNASIEFGSSANFKLADKSYFGPDRKSGKANAASLDLSPGVGLSYAVSSKVKLVLQYTYLHSISNSYVEELYWGSYTEPIKKFVYKYNTQAVTFGVQWRTR